MSIAFQVLGPAQSPLAPLTATAVGQAISGQRPDLDLAALSARRFGMA
ncbi:MAG: hypothetical protein WCC22_03910 [Terriglobales bacterium]